MQTQETTLFTKDKSLSKAQLVLITMAGTFLFTLALHLFITPAPLTEQQKAWLHKLDIELQIKANQTAYVETANEMNAKLDQLHNDTVELTAESAQITADVLGF